MSLLLRRRFLASQTTTDTTPAATGGTARHRAPAPYSDTFVAPDLRRRQRARRAAVLLIFGGL